MQRRLVLYTRAQCGLCHQMHAAAAPVATRYGVEIECVDIDDDVALAAAYNTIIPVLELDGAEVARYHLDPQVLERALATGSTA